MRVRAAMTAGAWLASLALHALAVLWLTRPEPRAVHQAWPEAVVFELVRSEPANEAAREPSRASIASAPNPGGRTRRPGVRSAAHGATVLEHAPGATPSAPDQALVEGQALTAVPAEPKTATLDLSPSAAASLYADELAAAQERTSSCRAAFPDAGAACAADAGPAPDEQLQAALSEAATRIPHLTPRPAPELKRGIDGSYRYEGHVFSALIQPDGSVSIADRPAAVQLGPLAIGGRFDLTDAVEKAMGKPIYSAEKRWFLQHTAELRRTLSDAAHAQRLARGSLRLRGRLERIVDDAGLSAQRKRELIFELWDGCAPDDVGVQAQQIVEQFVRDELPVGSLLAYTPTELAALNRKRLSPRAFEPYLPGDAGTPG